METQNTKLFYIIAVDIILAFRVFSVMNLTVWSKTGYFLSSRSIARILRKILHHETNYLVRNYLYVYGIIQAISFLRTQVFMKT